MTVTETTTTRTGEFSEELVSKATAARKASRPLSRATTEEKNRALEGIAALLEERSAEIVAANQRDYAAAQADGMSDVLLGSTPVERGTRARYGRRCSRHRRAA